MNEKICKDCRISKPTTEFQQQKYRCKMCEWKKLHNYQVLDGWTIEQYDIILDNIINIKIENINELIPLLNKSLEDILFILKNQLKVGNKPLTILWKCDQCQKEFQIHPCKFVKNDNIFCSHHCYSIYKKENTPLGKENPDYERIITNCTNCEKQIEVIPFQYKLLNKHGDNHNFCSQQCYYDFRSKYYVKEKSSFYKYKFTKKQINDMRFRAVNLYVTGVFDRETIPQKNTNIILQKLNINYTREIGFKYYSVDNYLCDQNLIIEVMGDYFHSNPNFYSVKNLNAIQRKGLKRDKSKKTYINKYYGIKILYLWESDINKRPELCKKLIQEYVNKNGELNNYNSFNYYLDENNNIKLKNKIVSPYYELSNKNP